MRPERNLSLKTAVDNSTATLPGFSHSFEQWAEQSQEVALQKMIANITPDDGEKGSVLASPSRSNPDYYYHWIRDAARTMGQIAERYKETTGQVQQNYHKMMLEYVEFSKINQTTPTPSKSLGEPKFYVTGQAYFLPWGRPQNDGPAQRALILTRWANDLLANGEKAYVSNVLYDGNEPSFSVIKADLDFVGHHWQDSCFDLWEEVDGSHFYTRMLMRSALREGAELATSLNDTGAADFYNQQADQIEQAMAQFWNEEKSYINATINRVGGLDYKASELDTAVIIGSCQSFSEKFPFLAPNSDEVLATAFALHEAFKNLYPINRVNKSAEGEPVFPGFGRYPEDKYNGSSSLGQANPWFLCTLAVSGVCFKAASLFKTTGSIAITSKNLNFLTMAVHLVDKSIELKVGDKFTKKLKIFGQIIKGLIALGNAYLERVRLHMADDGALSEQFDRNNGFMTSARDLTWSYVAMYVTAEWRKTLV